MTDRYEFRVFAPVHRYTALAHRFDGLLDAGAEERGQEVYLFSLDSTPPRNGLKLRNGELSIKRLIRHSGDLELWRPEIEPFPLDRTNGVRIARGCAMPPVPGGGWAEASHLLRDAEKTPNLCLAHVRKLRLRYARGALQGEMVRMEVNGAELASLAVEGEDPAALARLRADLDLAAWENVSYPRMLQYLAGVVPLPADAPARVAVR
jgi:hypothetical protein